MNWRRWGRFQDPDEAGHFEFLCRSAGVEVRYCEEAFDDTGSATAIIMKTVKRAMAADYSRQLSERVGRAKRLHVAANAWSGGQGPYGFLRQAFNPDGTLDRILGSGQRRPRAEQSVRLVPGPPAEIQTLRAIFDLFVRQDLSPGQIAARLNAQGVPYRKPGPWTYPRVHCVLKNELAIGLFVYNKSRSRLGGKPERLPPEVWTRHRVCPPLIPLDVFAEAQRKLDKLRRPRRSNEALIEALKRLLALHGRLTVRLVADTPGMPTVGLYVSQFGSIAQAFERAGYVAPEGSARRRLDRLARIRERMLAGLRRLLAQHGRLDVALIEADPDLPSLSTFHRHFGGVLAAYASVGYHPQDHKTVASGWGGEPSVADGAHTPFQGADPDERPRLR